MNVNLSAPVGNRAKSDSKLDIQNMERQKERVSAEIKKVKSDKNLSEEAKKKKIRSLEDQVKNIEAQIQTLRQQDGTGAAVQTEAEKPASHQKTDGFAAPSPAEGDGSGAYRIKIGQDGRPVIQADRAPGEQDPEKSRNGVSGSRLKRAKAPFALFSAYA